MRRLGGALQLVGYTLIEIVASSLRVAREVLSPRSRARPGVVRVPLDVVTDGQIAVLAHLVTLTPGTLTLDVSEDRRHLYVHAMFAEDPDALRRQIKDRLERRILEVSA